MTEITIQHQAGAHLPTPTNAVIATAGAVTGFNHSGSYFCNTGNWGVCGLQLPAHRCREQQCPKAAELMAAACALQAVLTHKIPIFLLVRDEEVFQILADWKRNGASGPDWLSHTLWREGYSAIQRRLRLLALPLIVQQASAYPHPATQVVTDFARRGLQMLATNRQGARDRQEAALSLIAEKTMRNLYP